MIGIFVISWQLTRRCNLECEYCYTNSLPSLSTEKELSTEECFSVLERLKNTPGISKEAMLIITGGEPFLRNDIFEIISKASENFFVVVGTNGIPLSEHKVTQLKELVKGVSVNIDYININNNFEFPELRKAIINKMATVKMLKEHNVPFIINTTLHQRNISELNAIAEFAYSNGAQSLNLFSLVPLGRGHDLYNLTISGYDNIISKVLEIKESYKDQLKIITKCAPHINARIFSETPENIRVFEGSGGCPAGKSYMYISAEGEVLPCPYFPLEASSGNVKDDNLEEVLKSKMFSGLRERNLKGKCGECEFSYLCSGCRARSFILTGDYLQEDSLCNYQPKGGVKVEEKTIIEKGGIVYGLKDNGSDSHKIKWTKDAEERIKRVPFFVRSFVKKKIENRAIEMNEKVINPEIMDKIKKDVALMHPAGKFGNMNLNT